MGISASSLLDETRSNYVKDQAEVVLKDFSPFFRRQFSVARFSQLEDDLEQNKEKITQLLKQKDAPQEAEVLYEEGVLYFDESRKWRERYVVVRANYCLECHDSLETFVKGVPPRQKLLPTGGAVHTTQEKYMAMVDRCFPDDSVVKEDFAPPPSGMPGQFPVYLRLPYRRDSYFCFKQQNKQDAFLAILSDCIRHQNQDFLKKKTCEVQAFLKAVQLYRQSRGKYEAWNMLIGSDVRVMGNLVMEQLLPSLEKDMLPRLKAKKTEKKRVWFATVEAAYILVQEHLLEGLLALKEDCQITARQQEVLIHSDMDQIVGSRRQLEDKVRAKVSERAEKLCSESVQPYLGSVLEELMEPVSSGFQEGRQLSETLMDEVCRDALQGDNERVKKVLSTMARPNLLTCYQKMASLQEKMQHLQDRFGFSNISGVINSAQIDLQQLMENAAYTFEQLFYKAVQDNPDNAGSAVEKAKHRVLKQYDYDSSTVRKRISQEALVSITLPFMKKSLDPTCRAELQSLEQSVDADYTNFINVENIYESVLLQTLEKEVTKVLKEAASLRKYNLFTDSRDLVSQSSLSSPSVSTPTSPAVEPASPLAVNGPPSSGQQEQVNGVMVGQEEAAPTVAISPEAHKAQDPVPVEPPAPADTAHQSETQEVEAAPETVIEEEVVPVKTEPAAEPDPPKEAETPPDQQAAPVADPAPGPDSTTEPVNTSAEGTDSQTVTNGEESSELVAPSSVQTPVLAPADLKQEEAAEPVPVPDLDPLDVAPSDVEIPEKVQATQNSGEEGSTTSGILEDEVNLSQSPVSAEEVSEERTASVEPSVEAAPASESTKEETPGDPGNQPPGSIKEIRDLVAEVVEVDELLQRHRSGVPKDE